MLFVSAAQHPSHTLGMSALLGQRTWPDWAVGHVFDTDGWIMGPPPCELYISLVDTCTLLFIVANIVVMRMM